MNLVLGAVRGLEAEQISPFLISLAKSGFKGRVAFFVSNISERTRKWLDDAQIMLLTIDEDTTLSRTPVNSLRYFVYEQLIDQLDSAITQIMHADVRDIFFQQDPFTIDHGGDLCCFLENERMDLSRCVANSGWLAAAYGKEALSALGHHPISCSGTTIGPAPIMKAYIRAMTAGLRAIDERVPNILHVIPGIDQAVHNYLLRTGGLPRNRCFRNEDGPILTLNYVKRGDITWNEDGLVVNDRNIPVHVLHQYDRHPALAEWALARLNNAPETT